MLERVMNYCNNFFVRTLEGHTYTIVADGIEGTFDNTYVAGQYICLDGTILNDGVYKIESVTSTKLTVEETLSAEDTDEITYLYGLAVPSTFVTLVDEINTYDDNVTYGIKSESQGNRSVTYGSDGGTSSGDSTWQSVYSKSLAPYKRMYCDKDTFYKARWF